ncbi:HTH_48 domain-containing protein [Trichonephila clavata]|uniref:HTH_48 domain-containing protein n=1 Tax=Trichonephila clavata TaxID=2740835 RepID=A0A8X6GJB8_TRICU|nr:HTH_48 domain-containing protein [Trichonephila clavata]
MQDHIKQSVCSSYSDVEDGKDRSTYRTLPAFRPVTLISFPRLRNQYVIAVLQHERTLLMLCANRLPDPHMVGQILRLMVFFASHIAGRVW